MTVTDTIDSQRVRDITMDCLVNTPEGEELPVDALRVEGILHDYAFDRAKLADYHYEVAGMLDLLPAMFHTDGREGAGGGWSFLNACYDRNDVQWTGEHWIMEMLFCLGIGMGLAKWLLPKDMWSALPGGMPYVAITLNTVTEPEQS